MRSRNPILKRGFGAGAAPSHQQLNDMYNRPAYGQQYPQQGYGQPYPQTQPGYGQPMPPGYGPAHPTQTGRTLTYDDVVVKSFITLGVLVLGAAFGWMATQLNPGLGTMLMIVGAIGGLVFGLWASFKSQPSPVLTLLYAAFQGTALGVISLLFNSVFNGIVTQAVLGTIFAFGAMLALYSFRVIRVTPMFTKVVIGAAVGALALVLVNLLVGFFVPGGLGLRTDSPLGWIFSIVMILIGCFFLCLDFKDIEDGVNYGAPRNFAWKCALGLTLTLVWIYLEVLRLLSYFQGGD
ncbi:Bax inhibitor-1/YccA family protein [Allonocardiopsis opalescens]|uniref:Putative YccA/Bax inhibitor family protein n=1 Tax=Allonocardiopsis opalescens TaxID=1144618 RepID=A0A2T0QD80_9ACTN|nr:Bax inhibitor-1/YccA family protein [Allonocardiopsis opalescens]PRY01865.1 putative YccA/Bax inhibitor family protein [Allonocardiopsis opalescens]